MIGARRCAIAGLLCVCSLMGCAQLPSRGLFARRTTPPADESRPDQLADHAVELGEPETVDSGSLSGDSWSTGSADGPIDVPGRSVADEAFSKVEAPTPNRRAAAPPAFVAAPDARELLPNSNLSTDRGGVALANHETIASEGSSEIELIAAKRRANTNASGSENPWDRFRGLTNTADVGDTSLNSAVDSAIASDQASTSSVPQRVHGNGTTSSVTEQPAIHRGAAQPQPWSEAFTPSAAGNSANDSMNRSNGLESWPRARGASEFTSTADNLAANPPSSTGGVVATGNWNTGSGFPAATNSPGVQQVSAEQPGFNGLPAAINRLPVNPAGNVPLNYGPPLTIAPFASLAELERLITQTAVEVAAVTPRDSEVSRQFYLRKHVQLRLLHLIAGQTDRALQPIPGVDSADQEFWQQMLWGMANYFDTQGMPDSSERATQTIAQLRTAAARLQEKARLELHNVAFCLKISGFGNYQRFKRDEFMVGQPVLLYAEVGDFKSEPTPDGQFRTLMKSTLEVLEGGPTGRLVESLPLTPSEDHCRNRRRDFYFSYEFVIPQSCNPGPHTLRLRVEDQLGKKTAVTTLSFTVQ
jgi:hypothetical protein